MRARGGRGTSAVGAVLGVVALMAAACAGDPSPTGPDPSVPTPSVPNPSVPAPGATAPDGGALPATGAIVSAVVPRSLLPAGLAGSGSLVFVSAAPGSFPGAMRAHILGSRGDSAVALVLEGGFDPLPVAGATGGLVTLSIVDSAGRTTTSSAKMGPALPRVVRLSPAARRTDVPLNVRIVAVFSAPVDSASAVAGVQLVQDGAVVPTQARLSPDRLEVVLMPDAPLDVNTTYEVTVAATVTDVFGTALGAPVSTSFTTGTSASGVPFLSVSGYEHPWRNAWLNLYKLQTGDTVGLALRQYENGPLSAYTEGVQTTWSSSDPSVLRVVELAPGYAIEVGLQPGRARLRAEALGVVVERDVEVVWEQSRLNPRDPATLVVQVNVTGTDPDTAFVLDSPSFDGAFCAWFCANYGDVSAGTNTLRFEPGAYTITLGDMATHCIATDGLTRDLSVGPRDTVRVTYSVNCGAAASTLRVRTTLSGGPLPPSFSVVYTNGNCLECSEPLRAGETRDIRVGPGQQSVTLLAVPYCLVQGPNLVQATVSPGAVLEVGFAVLCTSLSMVNLSVTTQGANADESFSIEGSIVGSLYDGSRLGLDRQPLDAWYSLSLRLPAGQSYRFLLSDIAANCRVVGDNPATVAVESWAPTSLNFNVACE